MGMEAEGELTTGGRSVHVKALLESRELIFRGAVKQTLPIAELTDPRAVANDLLFEHGGTAYALTLPTGVAAKWQKKLTTAPPTLAKKLGIDATHPARVWGKADDADLDAALHNITEDKTAQSVIIARTPDELSQGLAALAPTAAMWIIYPKGAKSPLPESSVRSHMRALGWKDTKVSSVSNTLTATRFSPPKT